MALNDLRCKNAKPNIKPYKLTDTAGLYLFVTPSGNKAWRFKYRYLGKEKTLTVGSYPAIPLQDARKLRDKAKEQLRNGDDPSFEKAEQKRLVSYKAAQTFDLITREWHNKYLDTWSPEHGKRIIYRLNKTVLQEIGHYPIGKLTPQLLLACLQKAESRSPELAITMLHYCRRIFNMPGLPDDWTGI